MLFNIGEQKNIQKSKHDQIFNTETMLPVSEIKNDTIILKDGGLRAVIKVTGLNLDLKNYDEQEIVLQQYKRFLNGLSFPIQILARSTYLDLSNYLGYIRANVSVIDNITLQRQGEQYLKFLEDIDMQQGLIYVKEFYIIVPYYEGEQDSSQINKSWRKKFLDILESKDSAEKIVSRYRGFLKNRNMLQTRCNLISDGLSAIGMETERITTPDIISLLFKFYNPSLHNSTSTMA